MARTRTKLCKLSHIRETKKERRKRLDARRERQLDRNSNAEYQRLVMARVALVQFKRRGIPALYGPHQGRQECERRVRQMAA